MAKILIVYATDYGNTKTMAEAVTAGAKSVNRAEVNLKLAEEATKEDVLSCDALIVGSPVHMGSSDWRVKKFIDTVCSALWMKDALIGKVAGVFVAGGGFGNAGGGCELTMLALLNNLAELGMIFIPLPKNTPGYRSGGLQWGPYGRSFDIDQKPLPLNKEVLEVAQHHGAHIARAATVLKNNDIFTKQIPATRNTR